VTAACGLRHCVNLVTSDKLSKARRIVVVTNSYLDVVVCCSTSADSERVSYRPRAADVTAARLRRGRSDRGAHHSRPSLPCVTRRTPTAAAAATRDTAAASHDAAAAVAGVVRRPAAGAAVRPLRPVPSCSASDSTGSDPSYWSCCSRRSRQPGHVHHRLRSLDNSSFCTCRRLVHSTVDDAGGW